MGAEKYEDRPARKAADALAESFGFKRPRGNRVSSGRLWLFFGTSSPEPEHKMHEIGSKDARHRCPVLPARVHCPRAVLPHIHKIEPALRKDHHNWQRQ
jgi:hypothetical protein